MFLYDPSLAVQVNGTFVSPVNIYALWSVLTPVRLSLAVGCLICTSLCLFVCIASSENTGNNTPPVEELQKTVESSAGRKRESTDSDIDGPSRKKTISGIQLHLMLDVNVKSVREQSLKQYFLFVYFI